MTGPPHPRVSNPPHVLPGPGPRPGHWKGVRGLLVVRSKGLFSAASPGVDALVTGSPEARQRPHLRGSSPSGHSLASGLWGGPSKVRHPLPRTCCPTGSGLGKLGLLFDSVPLRLEFPRSHFSQKTQGKIVIQITDKISEHTLPGARAAPTQGPASVQAQPWPSPVVGPPSTLPAGRPLQLVSLQPVLPQDTGPCGCPAPALQPEVQPNRRGTQAPSFGKDRLGPRAQGPSSLRLHAHQSCSVSFSRRVLFCPLRHPSTLLSPAGLRQSPETSRGPSF